MLFITNRVFEQGNTSDKGREVSFDLENNDAQQSVFFCKRDDDGKLTEIMSTSFLEHLRESESEEILMFLHGFSNLPEPHIFPRTQDLQALLDKHCDKKIEVIPIIWPCDADRGIVKDYFDDQVAADGSGIAFGRALQIFRKWQLKHMAQDSIPCLKRIHVLAHSMGNRVFRETMRVFSTSLPGREPPIVFRNTFLVAADIVNESLEPGQTGNVIPMATRNTLAYFASDDRALQASKVANMGQLSRRLGHTGPENMSKVARNVYALDCGAVNSRYDPLKGHSYFLYDEDGSDGSKPGQVFEHICKCVQTGRVPPLSNYAEDRIDFLE